jgi:hypothetical protein
LRLDPFQEDGFRRELYAPEVRRETLVMFGFVTQPDDAMAKFSFIRGVEIAVV